MQMVGIGTLFHGQGVCEDLLPNGHGRWLRGSRDITTQSVWVWGCVCMCVCVCVCACVCVCVFVWVCGCGGKEASLLGQGLAPLMVSEP